MKNLVFMFMKNKDEGLTRYNTNELLLELLKRGNTTLFPAHQDDELKIKLFRTFWNRLSFWDMFLALNNQLVKKSRKGLEIQNTRMRDSYKTQLH